MHLSNSPGLQNDDRVLITFNGFFGNEIVITEKYDGENTTLYSHGLHARSMDGRTHPSRDWVKKFHGSIAHEIPVNLRICGENMYAQHSIAYSELETYFYGFSVWEDETVLGWDDTLTWFKLLGITSVRELYRGPFCFEAIDKEIAKLDCNSQEGLVIRCTTVFEKSDFGQIAPKIAKWVRKNHVATSEHWMLQEVIPNKLKV